MDASFEGDELTLESQWDDELEQGSMRDLTREQLDEFRRRAVPQPAGAVRDAAQLRDDRRLDVPATIVCTAFSAADYRSYAEQGVPFLAGVLEHRALTMLDLPTGHWPMWSKPAELAALIDETMTSASVGYARSSVHNRSPRGIFSPPRHLRFTRHKLDS